MEWKSMSSEKRSSQLKSLNVHTAIRRGVTLLIFLCLQVTANGQPLVQFDFKSFGLEDVQNNVIHNASHLEVFFEHLYQQKMSNDRVISILHFGDSHIQGDYMTTVVRRNFQSHFGNAGRGFIVPYRVAGTNEPPNFISRSSTKWVAKRCVHPYEPLPIGLGGITISTNDPKARLEFYLNDLWMDYASRKFSLFYLKDHASFNFVVKDTLGTHVGKIDPLASPFDPYSEIKLATATTSLVVDNLKTSDAQNHATIFGALFSNETNGIFYHAIGVNGAKYDHYNAAQLFAKQTSALRPEVIIISLGTNEAINYPYVDRNLLSQIDRLITSLHLNNPQAQFILTTPPNGFRKKTKHNPGIALVRETILQYAVEHGYAFYDLYKAMGGDNAANMWKAAGLLRPDGVHFTKEGYEYQGNLLFSAIMRSYNEFVPLRHP
jgi:lysophospholipase L1-like esterase